MSVWTLPSFDVIRPRTIAELTEQVDSDPEHTQILAGGTDLIPSLRMRLFNPSVVVDIQAVEELQGIEETEEGWRIGAAVRLTTIEKSVPMNRLYPTLVHAVQAVAAPNIRNMGTLGGNLLLDTRCHWYNQSYGWRRGIGFCLKKEGSVCHVAPSSPQCWAAYSGDTAAALLTLDATAELVSVEGRRRINLSDLYLNDGKTRHTMKRNEVLASIHLPKSSGGLFGRYDKLRIRKSIDYPLAGIAFAAGRNGTLLDIRIGLTGVNPRPIRVPLPTFRLDDALSGIVARAQRAVGTSAKPLKTSLHVPPDYRRHWLKVMTRRGVTGLVERIRSSTPGDSR